LVSFPLRVKNGGGREKKKKKKKKEKTEKGGETQVENLLIREENTPNFGRGGDGTSSFWGGPSKKLKKKGGEPYRHVTGH